MSFHCFLDLQYSVFKVRPAASFGFMVLRMGLSRHYLLYEGLCLLKPVGLSGLEPPTSRLSGVRSNRLSYKPEDKLLNFSFIKQVNVSI